jgi:hypothetical protein
MDFMTPLATIADASLHMICKSEVLQQVSGKEIPVAVCVDCSEASLAYNLIATCHKVIIENLGPDDPKLRAMCATAKHAKHCLLKARANTAEINESLAGKSCDLDEIHRLRREYNALHFNAGPFCLKARHQVIFDQTVNLVPGQFERGVIEAAAKQENVFVVPGPSETALAFVATDPPCFGGAAGLSLIPGTFDPQTTATFADFDPLGAGAELYSNGLDATAKLYADASAIADSTEFKMLSLRALCAAAAQTSASHSQEAKARRVWRAILAFVEKDPQERAKLVDVMVLLQDLAYKTTAATGLHTTCIPSLRLLTAISTSVQKGDLMAFATNYAAATQKMAQGLAPGQRAYFTITNTPSTGTGGAEAAESAGASESAEAAEATESAEPGESPLKRARADSTSGLPGRESGRESTVA